MLTKNDTPGAEGFWLGLLILAVGVTIGVLIGPQFANSSDSARGEHAAADPPTLHPLLQPDDAAATASDNQLTTLELVIPEASAAVLQRVRDRAMERGLIVQDDADTVEAEVLYDGRRHPAEIRIKGDWTDHVASDKWSLRIKLRDGHVLGMSTFSIQAPETRGDLWEWLMLEAGRREGLLAPRASFVNVVLNGNAAGIYFLEEHFSKELLESQGRRDGPIVRWDEGTGWSMRLQSHTLAGGRALLPVPVSSSRALTLAATAVRAYGEKHLGSTEALSQALASAIQKMRDLRTLAVLSQYHDDPQRVLLALDELRQSEGDRSLFTRTELLSQAYQDPVAAFVALDTLQSQSLDELMNVQQLARAHALYSLMQIRHGLIADNMRYYLDPVLDRLEPVLFDNMAHRPSPRAPVPFRAEPGVYRLGAVFASNDAYYNGVFEQLGELCRPTWVDELFRDLEPELSVYAAALHAESPLPVAHRVPAMKQRLRAQQLYLHKVLFPVDALNVAAFVERDDAEHAPVSGSLRVEAWATTRTPVVVEAFRFENGARVLARDALAEGVSLVSQAEGGGVVLSPEGVPAVFRFPMDERLANLESVQQVKAAVRSASQSPDALDLNVTMLFRPLASGETQEQPLTFRDDSARPDAPSGRPDTPSLEQALERHPFLRFDPVASELVVRPGTWRVEGDLVVPRGVPLRAGAGVELQFEAASLLLAEGPLFFEGTAAEPVLLRPVEGTATWRGICVLSARARSEWRHVVVRDTQAVSRGAWSVTGGVTFYRSPVSMRSTHIEGSLAEDGLNIVGSDMLLVDVTISGCVSDSFDGDFVTGSVQTSVFRDGEADGVDFSGSRVQLRDCVFERLGDKAVSIGEDSEVLISGGHAHDVSLGVAAKDRSKVSVEDMRISGARNYALAAFIKKSEFGPAQLSVVRTDIQGSGRGDALAQTGCRLTIDGVEVPTRDLDVAQLYEDGILGR